MKSEFRKVALELYSTNEVNHVKLAGVFSRLRNWVSSLFNKNHAEDVMTFQDANTDLQMAAKNIIPLLTDLDAAIDSYDLIGYSQKLSELKQHVASLQTLLSKTKQESVRLVNEIKQEIKPAEPVAPAPVKIQPKIMTLESQEGKVFSESFFKDISPDSGNMRFVGEGFRIALAYFKNEGVEIHKNGEAKFQQAVYDGIYSGTIINQIVDTRVDVEGILDLVPIGVRDRFYFKVQCRIDAHGILHVQGFKKNSLRMAAANVLIEIRGEDSDANIEFARVLSASLESNWNVHSSLYFDNKNVQVDVGCDSSSDVDFACRNVYKAFAGKFASMKCRYYIVGESVKPTFDKLTISAENKSFRAFRLKYAVMGK
jgi:hypothetical protein